MGQKKIVEQIGHIVKYRWILQIYFTRWSSDAVKVWRYI